MSSELHERDTGLETNEEQSTDGETCIESVRIGSHDYNAVVLPNYLKLIDITGVPKQYIIEAAYRESRPMGMGYLHFQEGEISKGHLEMILEMEDRNGIHMDYVSGRAVKLTIYKNLPDGQKLNNWRNDLGFYHLPASVEGWLWLCLLYTSPSPRDS